MFGRNKIPDDAGCPLWRAPCRKEKCDWWCRLEYKHPKEQSTRWHEGCAVVMGIQVQLDLMQKIQQNTASVDKVANEVATNRAADEVRHASFVQGLSRTLPPLVKAITDTVEDRVNGHGVLDRLEDGRE